MAPSSLNKQLSDCDSPYDWLMSLAMDLQLRVTCAGKNGTNGCHLTVFSEGVAFPHHCVVPQPPPSHPITVLVVFKILAKMVDNSASYPVYSRHSEKIP